MYKNRYYILHAKNVMTDYEFRVTIIEKRVTSFIAIFLDNND